MDMESFEGVQMGSFTMVMQYLLLYLNAFSCSLNRVTKRLSVCQTYALLQSGHVNLYIPDSEYLSGLGFLWDSRLPMVFVVRMLFLVVSFEIGL